jgi:hypothetical protein
VSAKGWINTDIQAVVDDLSRLGLEKCAEYQMDLIRSGADERWVDVALDEMREELADMLEIIDGHPVPYSLTVQINGESIQDARKFSVQIAGWLAAKKPEMEIVRYEGAYVFYEFRKP